jgi:HEAT repeat protein
MDDHIAALEAAPTCWTLSDALDRGETTYRGYLWFSDPQNSCWEPLYRGKAVEALLAELRDLREELAASEARADMHADLGRRTAEALGIPLDEGRAHMPEVAKALQQQNEALLKDIDYFRRVMIQAGEQQDALRADAERLQWLLDHPLWSVSYRIRPGKAKEYRMREEGEYWGQWWPTGRQAIDKARAIKAAQAAKERA